MKKLFMGMAAMILASLPCQADNSNVAFKQAFTNNINSATVPSTATYTIDLNQYGAESESFQVTISSASPPTNTFNDGTVSTGAITVVTNSALSAQSSSDTITVKTTSALVPTAGSDSLLCSNIADISTGQITLVVNSSNTLVFGVSLSSNIATSTGTAQNIAAVINAINPPLNVTATVSGSSVIITCNVNGSFCNSFTLSSTTNTVTAASSNFTGGNDNSFFNLNGSVFVQGQSWNADVSYASNTALSIMNAININSAYTASTNTTTSVLIKVTKTGSYPNGNYTLTASTGALTILSATFAGGQDNAFLTIDGRLLTQGNQWTSGTTAALTANSIQTAINSDSVLSTILIATAPSGSSVVYATGTIISVNSPGYTSIGNNYLWFTSTSAALSVSNSGLYGGTTSAFIINSPLISVPNNGLATGEAVKFSTGVVILSLLSNQTTYYAIYVDTNDIELSLTSTGAIAGIYVTLTSSSTTGPHTYTLTPPPLAGTMPLVWSESNDCLYFSTPTVTVTGVTIPTNVISTPWGLTTYTYDFGPANVKCLRLTVSGPTTAGYGGLVTEVFGFGKKSY